MRSHFALALAAPVLLTGCHSKYIQATMTNRSGETLHVVQVEYPSASFGTQELKPGESFHYRFKLLGSGPVKLSYLDDSRHEHDQVGPNLNEGQEGRLEIVFASANRADFRTSVRP